jgi:hypothetical protein
MYGAIGLAYELEVTTADGTVAYSQIVGETPDTGTHELSVDLPFDTGYAWRARAALGTNSGPWSVYGEFRTPKNVTVAAPVTGGTTTTPGFRTPDPPAGQRLPRPNHQGVVNSIAAANPAALRNSCQPEGGSWFFMDTVVDTLRNIDSRYGYNCKRGNCNDPSLDVISYHWGAGPDEKSTQVYCTDLIAGHCGSNPGLIWNDVTQITLDSGTVCAVMFTRPGRKR